MSRSISPKFVWKLLIIVIMVSFWTIMWYSPSFLFPISKGDTPVVSYDVENRVIDNEIVVIEEEFLLGVVYYEINGSNYLSYLSTDYSEIRRDIWTVTVDLHHYNHDHNETTEVTVWSGTVTSGIDRYPYLGLNIIKNDNGTVMFSGVHRNKDHLYYQKFDYNGAILNSTEILKNLHPYFNHEMGQQIGNDTLVFEVGKYLSDDTSQPMKYILLYNLTDHKITEIEMRYEFYSFVYDPIQERIFANYRNEEGSETNIGIFDLSGALVTELGEIEGKLYQAFNGNRLLIGLYGNDDNNLQLVIFAVQGGFIILVVGLLLYNKYRNNQKIKSKEFRKEGTGN